MTVPCEGQLLLLTPPFDGLTPEPIVLGSMKSCPGLVDEHGTQVSSPAPPCIPSLSRPYSLQTPPSAAITIGHVTLKWRSNCCNLCNMAICMIAHVAACLLCAFPGPAAPGHHLALSSTQVSYADGIRGLVRKCFRAVIPAVHHHALAAPHPCPAPLDRQQHRPTRHGC